MSDLIDEAPEGTNAPEFSVSELSGAIKRMIEGEFAHVRIKGEVGRVSLPRSGHIYLDLKDDRAVISGVIWKGVAQRLSVQPEEGMEVVATGRLTTFPGQSKYQIVIDDIKPAGMGALMAMLEKRKAALAAEGLFDPARKRPLPYLPEIIGVITSPSGAVIRDILHRLRDRFPRKVLIWPVAVQGDKCASEVARAIAGFNALSPGGALPRPDLLIVARGGGSLEDLWGFNEEIVARAAAASDIPLISAVGHETDTTLIDYAADKRAPTPTAAAELAVPVRLELLAWLDGQAARLSRAQSQQLAQRGQRLRDLARALPRPISLLDSPRQRLDRAADRLPSALTGTVQRQRLRLLQATGSLRPATLQRHITAEDRSLQATGQRLVPALARAIASHRQHLQATSSRLGVGPLRAEAQRQARDLARLSQRLADAGLRQTTQWRSQLEATERLRETLGYKATLARGYAVVRAGGQVATTTAAAAGKALEIEFADGRLQLGPAAAAAPSPSPDTAESPAKPAKPRKKPVPPGQGSLF